MKTRLTVLFLTLIAFAAMSWAGDAKVVKYYPDQKPVSNKAQLIKPALEQDQAQRTDVPDFSNKVKKVRNTAASTHLQVGISGNGYGWLNPSTRGVDRYAGPDTYNQAGGEIDFVLAGFRDEVASNINAVQLDVANGLANAVVWDKNYWGAALNSGLGGNGGRYPAVVALDKPFVAFNQYMAGDGAQTPTTSHPYAITDYLSYGSNGGAWTTPSYIMDQGWVHPTVSGFSQFRENRLWNGAVSVVKDAQGMYHYCGVYETWFSDLEVRVHGVENDNHILTATSDDPSLGWTYGWTVGNNPVRIDPQAVSLPRLSIDMNSSGFGVIAGPGHLGWHHPDSGYYYVDIRITYATTMDYGVTWSAWDTVSFGDVGFPLYHNPQDSLLFDYVIVGQDTLIVPYNGPTFMGTNFDMDAIVDEDNNIYVGFNSLWGKPGAEGWYPSAYYSGRFVAVKQSGFDWGAARIWYPNGAFTGDEDGGSFFFDSEIDLALDENGVLYAAWLDRRNTGVQVSAYNRYTDPASGSFQDYVTDIYASRSLNGGATWSSQPINITDSPSIDEYELNLAKSAAARNDGTVWVGYCVADLTGATPATDYYINLPNAVWISEANEFYGPPSAIDETVNEPILRGYALDQNYPNPFNPTTRIAFVPQEAGEAVLAVYNVSGQKIAELYHGQAQKGIEYAVDFNGSNLAAGIYFYRLTIGNQVEVKKMALIK